MVFFELIEFELIGHAEHTVHCASNPLKLNELSDVNSTYNTDVFEVYKVGVLNDDLSIPIFVPLVVSVHVDKEFH
jgi:hypothetical protein